MRTLTYCSLVVAAIVQLSGCASFVTTSPVLGETQTQMYMSGSPVLFSKKTQTVAMGPTASMRTANERPTFILVVANPTEKPVEVDTQNVTAFINGRSVNVLTFEGVEREIRSAQVWAALAGTDAATVNAVNSSLNSARAGQRQMFRRETVNPGKTVAGTIVLGVTGVQNSLGNLVLRVNIGADVHEFSFQVTEAK